MEIDSPVITRTTVTQDTKSLESVVSNALNGLPPSATRILLRHPHIVRRALEVAAVFLGWNKAGGHRPDVETLEPIKGPSMSPEEVKRGIAERTVEYEPDEEVLNSSEAAARIGLKSRQAVHDRRRKGTIVGWPGAKRGYVFPARQFDERNRVVAGVCEIVTLLGDAYEGWVWLTTPDASTGGEEPLMLLARGERERVFGAVNSYLQGDFS